MLLFILWGFNFPPPQILDFGLARQADAEMTGYVVTRWYRAPEVILNWMRYTQTGKPSFIPCALAKESKRGRSRCSLCSSGYLVGWLHHGGDAAGKAAVQGHRPYPWISLKDNLSLRSFLSVKSARDETWPALLSDLDQLREIMKVTGTPSGDFVVKLQSQDVCVNSAKMEPIIYQQLQNFRPSQSLKTMLENWN